MYVVYLFPFLYVLGLKYPVAPAGIVTIYLPSAKIVLSLHPLLVMRMPFFSVRGSFVMIILYSLCTYLLTGF